MEISKRLLVFNILLSQGILIFLAFGIDRLILPDSLFRSILTIKFNAAAWLAFILGSIFLFMLQLFFHHYVSKEKLRDEINQILMDTFNLPELSLIFFFGAFAEEILFRGILQPTLGVWLTSLLFTVIHFRYLKKGYLLIEVFLMGMILGFSYWIAQTVWVPVCCHFFVNLVTAWLVKKGLWQY